MFSSQTEVVEGDASTNLEALAEDEEESYETDASEEEKGDGGIRRGEPNKFDSLCDGVLNTLALIHASLKEVMDVKDELMKHSLPPNVLTKISIVNSKLFRSIGDMHMPVHELIRMVRIYSTPWEEKSAALKKLHEDYEAKKGQLNIAIKRLQLVDAQSRRMNHDKRIMNWEKLFCRITSSRGHGRRWKFLIDSFKKKAKEGIPALSRYLDDMEQASDSDEEEPVIDYPVLDTQVEQLATSEEATIHPSDKEEESDTDSSDEEDEEESKDVKDSELESDMGKQEATYIRPVMKDQQSSTNEPDFERFLYVKVYTPEGLDYKELKCSLTSGKETYKTDIMDPLPVEDTELSDEKKPEEPKPSPGMKRGRGPGLIGSRGSLDKTPSPKPEETKIPKVPPRFEECLFSLPENDLNKMLTGKKQKDSELKNLRVAVTHGPMSELVAMATIDMDDLKSLDLPSLILPYADDCADVIRPGEISHLIDDEGDLPESSRSTTKSESIHSADESKFNLPKKYQEVEPIPFPLYSVHAGKGEDVHLPCGQLPLVLFWARKLKPRKYHKATEAENLRDIVLDLTGFDLYEVTKEDLHKEKVERSVSAMSIVPEQKEDTVLRTDYDRLMRTHREEMEILQDEYEVRLQELAESLHQMQTMQYEAQRIPPTREASTRSTSPSRHDNRTPHPPREIRMPQQPQPRLKRRLGKSAPNYGESLPKDFFERLRLFEEMSQKHKQEMSEKTNKEIREYYEKKLAGEFKLGPGREEDGTYNPLQDVSLPAVFMPTKGRDLTIYNPRASKYFHATGSTGLRLTQPPSMVQLPPLPQSKISVINLFDVSRNFQSGGNEWLIQRYMQQSQQHAEQERAHAMADSEQDMDSMQDGMYNLEDGMDPDMQHDMGTRHSSILVSSRQSRVPEAMLD